MKENEVEKHMILPRKNLILIGIGFLIVLVGMLLMIGGGSDDPLVFDPEIFSFRRITLAPIVVLIGLVFVIYAIMKRPGKES